MFCHCYGENTRGSLPSPLLSEYDHVINEMSQKIISYQVENVTAINCIRLAVLCNLWYTYKTLQAEAQVLASRVEQVVEENNRYMDVKYAYIFVSCVTTH